MERWRNEQMWPSCHAQIVWIYPSMPAMVGSADGMFWCAWVYPCEWSSAYQSVPVSVSFVIVTVGNYRWRWQGRFHTSHPTSSVDVPGERRTRQGSHISFKIDHGGKSYTSWLMGHWELTEQVMTWSIRCSLTWFYSRNNHERQRAEAESSGNAKAQEGVKQFK